MTVVLVGDSLWAEIRRRAANSQSLVAFVGYLGRHPSSVLKWPRRSTVICNLEPGTVARGVSSARGARELLSKGVELFSLRDLHAKIYLFDSSAIVCSANLSESSGRLIEAGVLLTKRATIQELRVHVRAQQLKAQNVSDDTYLIALARTEPESPQVPVAHARSRRSLPFFGTDPVSIDTCVPDLGETLQERKAKKTHAQIIASDHGMSKPTAIDWINACSLEIKDSLPIYHYCFYWWRAAPNAKRAKFGYLDGPWQSLGGVDLGPQFKSRRYCVPMTSRRHRKIPIDQGRLERLAAILGRKTPRDPARLWEAMNEKTGVARLSPKGIEMLCAFLLEER